MISFVFSKMKKVFSALSAPAPDYDPGISAGCGSVWTRDFLQKWPPPPKKSHKGMDSRDA